MSASQLPTPAEDPALWANHNGEVLGASVTLLALPTIFVALRLLSRYMSGAGLWVRPSLYAHLLSPAQVYMEYLGIADIDTVG